MNAKEIDLAKQYSKTFVLADIYTAVDAVNILDLRALRILHENKIRITVSGNQVKAIENLMQLFGAFGEQGDPGEWRDSAH